MDTIKGRVKRTTPTKFLVAMKNILTQSNKFGIVILWGMTVTNEELDLSALGKNTQPQMSNISTSKIQTVGFAQPTSISIEYLSSRVLESPEGDDEQFLFEFATKLITSQRDIDPEISQVISKRFWDML